MWKGGDGYPADISVAGKGPALGHADSYTPLDTAHGKTFQVAGKGRLEQDVVQKGWSASTSKTQAQGRGSSQTAKAAAGSDQSGMRGAAVESSGCAAGKQKAWQDKGGPNSVTEVQSGTKQTSKTVKPAVELSATSTSRELVKNEDIASAPGSSKQEETRNKQGQSKRAKQKTGKNKQPATASEEAEKAADMEARMAKLSPLAKLQIDELLATSKAIIRNTVSTSKKKKAQLKADLAKQRKLLHPLSEADLLRLEAKSAEVDEYRAGTRDEFRLGDGVIVRRTPESRMRKRFGIRGLDAIRPRRRRHYRFACLYDVQVQTEELEFTVVSRLGGNDGENLRTITRTNMAVHLRLEGTQDGEPLVIHVETSDQASYEYACRDVEKILLKVYRQLDNWAVDKDHVIRNICLEVRKLEKRTDYDSILEAEERKKQEADARVQEAKNQAKSQKRCNTFNLLQTNPIVQAVGPAATADMENLIPSKPHKPLFSFMTKSSKLEEPPPPPGASPSVPGSLFPEVEPKTLELGTDPVLDSPQDDGAEDERVELDSVTGKEAKLDFSGGHTCHEYDADV
ncbi:unnamed protein product [Amoebophrya sp. A25]|nr:unnamed protein product [Amoebophrya sp. A25]|eukprot:GSA25T00011391001.1